MGDEEKLPLEHGDRLGADVWSHVCGHFVRVFIPDVRASGDWLACHPRRTARR
jgi:hypothetical protein